MSGLYREVNKPDGEAFMPWYAKRCGRPVDIVECADGTWGVRRHGSYEGHVWSTPEGRFTARHFTPKGTLPKRARTFRTFRRAMSWAARGK